MSKSLRLTLVSILTALVVAGCVLRPQYRDLIAAADPSGDTAAVALVAKDNGAPIAGATVTFGEGKDKVVAKTGEDGVVVVPRSKRLDDANPIVVVELPPGIGDYQFVAAQGSAKPQAEGEGVVPNQGPGQPGPLNQPAEPVKPSSGSGGEPSSPPMPSPDAAPALDGGTR